MSMIDKIAVAGLSMAYAVKATVARIQWIPETMGQLGEYLIVLGSALAAVVYLQKAITWFTTKGWKK